MDFKHRILAIAKSFHFSSDKFDSIGIHDWPDVFKKIEAKFIIKENSNAKFNWWWENLREEKVVLQFLNDDALNYLHLIVNKNEKCWFVACDSDRDRTKYWLFEGFTEPIQLILRELPAIEYYLVSKKYDWILAENHHGNLIGLGSIQNKLLALETKTDK